MLPDFWRKPGFMPGGLMLLLAAGGVLASLKRIILASVGAGNATAAEEEGVSRVSIDDDLLDLHNTGQYRRVFLRHSRLLRHTSLINGTIEHNICVSVCCITSV